MKELWCKCVLKLLFGQMEKEENIIFLYFFAWIKFKENRQKRRNDLNFLINNNELGAMMCCVTFLIKSLAV